jgi:LPS export ABC transporter protein LptC
LILLVGCGTKDQPARIQPQQGRTPSQTIFGFKLIETILGKRSWVLMSDQADTYDKSQEVDLRKLNIDFYKTGTDSINATLTADFGKVNTATRDMEANQNVRVVTKDSLVLITDHLTWNNDTKKLFTESAIRLEKGTDWLTGEGLEASSDLKEIQIKKNVRGQKDLLNIEP